MENYNSLLILKKQEWIALCKKYNKWCLYEEVYNLSYEQAEFYIKNMPVWEVQ